MRNKIQIPIKINATANFCKPNINNHKSIKRNEKSCSCAMYIYMKTFFRAQITLSYNYKQTI